jgi:AcrR family transcriptional regulator
MNASAKPERTRLSAEDWEDAALKLIADQGVGALAVEALARQLGVTKGSFYWHFRTREALLQASLERWEQYGEREVIEQIEAMPDPRARLPELFRRVAHELAPHRVYAALLKALDHPQVVPVMARVSQRRMEFLTTIYREAGLPPAEALNRARLTYAAYVGFLQLNFTLGLPRISHDEFDGWLFLWLHASGSPLSKVVCPFISNCRPERCFGVRPVVFCCTSPCHASPRKLPFSLFFGLRPE